MGFGCVLCFCVGFFLLVGMVIVFGVESVVMNVGFLLCSSRYVIFGLSSWFLLFVVVGCM